jgi:DNA-binding LytR/AlgR family response regulator
MDPHRLHAPRPRTALTVGLWLAQYAVLTGFSLGGHYPHALDAGLRRALTTVFGMLLCMAMGRLLDRRPARTAGRQWATALSLAMAASAVWALFAYAVGHLSPSDPIPTARRLSVPRELALNAAAVAGLFTAWVCGWMAIAARETLKRVTADVEPRPQGAGEVPGGSGQTIWVRTRRGKTRLALDTVERLEAERDYVRLHARSGQHLVHGGLQSIAERLEPGRFLRVHRSFVVNLTEIVGVERRAGGLLDLVLTSGARIPVGRTHQRSVRARLLALHGPSARRVAR